MSRFDDITLDELPDYIPLSSGAAGREICENSTSVAPKTIFSSHASNFIGFIEIVNPQSNPVLCVFPDRIE